MAGNVAYSLLLTKILCLEAATPSLPRGIITSTSAGGALPGNMARVSVIRPVTYLKSGGTLSDGAGGHHGGVESRGGGNKGKEDGGRLHGFYSIGMY